MVDLLAGTLIGGFPEPGVTGRVDRHVGVADAEESFMRRWGMGDG